MVKPDESPMKPASNRLQTASQYWASVFEAQQDIETKLGGTFIRTDKLEIFKRSGNSE